MSINDSTRSKRIEKYRTNLSSQGMVRSEVYISKEMKEKIVEIGKQENVGFSHMAGLLLEMAVEQYYKKSNKQINGIESFSIAAACAAAEPSYEIAPKTLTGQIQKRSEQLNKSIELSTPNAVALGYVSSTEKIKPKNPIEEFFKKRV